MKKLLSMTILLMMVLAGCNPFEASNPIEPTEHSMVINFKNHANFDFYGLEVAILNSSSGTVNADGSKIAKGEIISFEFLEEDFALDGDTEMQVAIIKNNEGEVIPINQKVTIELANNVEILFELTGESINEAEIKRIK